MVTTFTVEEIRKYILSQDSLGDVLYNLNEKNIIKANLSKHWVCNECGFSDYSDSVSEEDLENLQCSNCGCNEFTLKTIEL